MNVVQRIQNEMDELEAKIALITRHITRLDNTPQEDWQADEYKNYPIAIRYRNDMWDRLAELEAQLTNAVARQLSQRKSYRQTHPTLGDIWPKGAK